MHVNDGATARASGCARRGIAHTASDDNIGICYAMNEAAMLARHEHLVYMNDDMYCLPGWGRCRPRRGDAVGSVPAPGNQRSSRATAVIPAWVVGPYGDGVDNFREGRSARRTQARAR